MVATLDNDEMPKPVRQIMDQLLVEFITIGFLRTTTLSPQTTVVTIAAPVPHECQQVALKPAVTAAPPQRVQIHAIGKDLTEETQ